MSFGNVQLLSTRLKKSDPELYSLIRKERQRQIQGLELIASENFTSFSVFECLGSCLTNKYSEGLPMQRYYGGNEFIDQIELMCQSRALEAFNLSSHDWAVNVQPYSGSPANFAVYTALVGPNGRIMGLDLADGGHLTHGYKTATRNVSATSLFFQSTPYHVNPDTGLIDYEKLAETARSFKPNLIVAGISAYSRCLDYEKFRKICDEHNAYLFSDMAHVSGLVSAGIIAAPFKYSDVVSTTAHKTLRGPRAAVIFYRKGRKTPDFESKINNSVFPGLQGGPHNNAIAAMATSFLQARSEAFRKYQSQVVKNAQALAKELENLGLKIVTGGTDIHLFLTDLKPFGINGSIAEHALDQIGVTCNKNTVPGDKSALSPSGIRLGTPALTTRGLLEKDMKIVANFIHKGLILAKEAQIISGSNLTDFKKCLNTDKTFKGKVEALRKDVMKYAEKLYMPQDVIQ